MFHRHFVILLQNGEKEVSIYR